MTKKNLVINTILSAALFCGGVTLAQTPVMNIDPKGHPDLADAQKAILDAYSKVDIAQRANKDKLGGHGEGAKQLLVKAAQELKLAEETADGKIPAAKR